MDNKKLLALCAALVLCGCNDSVDITSVNPGNNNNPQDSCGCKTGYVCIKGECSPLYDNLCDPECEAGKQICVNNKCEDIKPADSCKPACDAETQACAADGACHYVDPWCEPGTCSNDNTQKCAQVEGKNAGKYESCDAGTSCFRGECVSGIVDECTTGTCNAEGTSECIGGSWKPCSSNQKCTDGACQLDTTVSCEPHSCIDGYPDRYCSYDGQIESCVSNTVCVDGECEKRPEIAGDILWTLCDVKSDCSYGICMKDMMLSVPVYPSGDESPVLSVPIQRLDPRIPQGRGICSTDCTYASNACVDNSGKPWGTCQLAYYADSPYVNKDAEGNTIPFPLVLDPDKLALSSPYSAICRPNVIENDKTYKTSFCKVCSSDESCDGYTCKDGMCLPPCKETANCPASFSCQIEEGAEIGICYPNAGECGDCLDPDNDSYGIGNCANASVDCDETDKTAYYLSTEAVCEAGKDRNCNGYDDSIEKLGTVDNCASCGSICKLQNGAENMSKTCVHVDGDGNEDGMLRENLNLENPETWHFTCKTTCDPGYADCDGDPDNGCEVQIANVQTIEVDTENHITQTTIRVTGDGHLFAIDNDADNYGDSNISNQYYCCPDKESGEPSTVCYANSNSAFNPRAYWAEVDFESLEKDCSRTITDPETGEISTEELDCAYHKTVVTNGRDCNDTDDKISPDAQDVCDGIDNDCNAETADGIVNTYNPKTRTTYAPEDSTSDTEAIALNAKCYNHNAVTDAHEQTSYMACGKEGIVACNISTKELYCQAESSDGTPDGYITIKEDSGDDPEEEKYRIELKHDGFDDDCDGLIDEDGMIPCLITDEEFDPSSFDTDTPYVTNLEGTKYSAYNTIGVENYYDEVYKSISEKYEKDIKTIENDDGSLSLCRIGILKSKVVYNPKTDKSERTNICESIYKPRVYDFYGDGIDANCDGTDYDVENAKFVKTGTQSTTECQQTGGKVCCTSKAPCEKLNDAVTNAKTKAGTYYGDILVSTSVSSITNSISLPVGNMPQNILELAEDPYLTDPGYTATEGNLTHIFDVHSVLAKRIAMPVDDTPFDPNKYLFDTKKLVGKVYQPSLNYEQNQPKELIRIYGGFSTWNSMSSTSKIDAVINTAASGYSNSNIISLFKPAQSSGNLSLRLKNLAFTLSAKNNTLDISHLNGATFVGINGYNHPSNIILDKTTITINAPAGYSFSGNAEVVSGASTTNVYDWQNISYNMMSGFRGHSFHFRDYDIEYKNYASCDHKNPCTYDSNGCSFNYLYGGGSGQINSGQLDKVYDSNYCKIRLDPDSSYVTSYIAAPGGMGGYYYHNLSRESTDYDHCSGFDGCGGTNNTQNYSLSSIGYYKYGSTSSNTYYYAQQGKGSSQVINFTYNTYFHSPYFQHYISGPDGDIYSGRSGYTGKTGRSGNIQYIKLDFKKSGDGIYIRSDRSYAHGEPGQPGGGGGGGSITKCYRAYCAAGSGGNGGCGGQAGRAGGTGGSAVGIMLHASSKPTESEPFTNIITYLEGSKIAVSSGAGGKSESGGNGGDGGTGGVAQNYTHKDSNDKVSYYISSGPGGVGGAGGGGGAGAPGKPGLAFPFIIACGPNLSNFSDVNANAELLSDCGFKIQVGDDANILFDDAGVANSYMTQSCNVNTYTGSKYSDLGNKQGYADESSKQIDDISDYDKAKDDGILHYDSTYGGYVLNGRNGVPASGQKSTFDSGMCKTNKDKQIFFKLINNVNNM